MSPSTWAPPPSTTEGTGCRSCGRLLSMRAAVVGKIGAKVLVEQDDLENILAGEEIQGRLTQFWQKNCLAGTDIEINFRWGAFPCYVVRFENGLFPKEI